MLVRSSKNNDIVKPVGDFSREDLARVKSRGKTEFRTLVNCFNLLGSIITAKQRQHLLCRLKLDKLHEAFLILSTGIVNC